MALITKQEDTITFSGHSDDLVHVTSSTFAEEFSDGANQTHQGTFYITGKDGSAKVHVLYDGEWSFAYGIIEEGQELPDWNTKHEVEANPYCTSLSLTVPERTAIVWEPARDR